MGATNKDTITLKTNKEYYDNLPYYVRENFDIMAVHLSGFDYELDELHQGLKLTAKELGTPYFKAQKQLRARENYLREQKIKEENK